MGIYSENTRDEDFGIDMRSLVEAFLIDDLTHNYGEETIKEFCAPGGVGEALVEAKVLSNKNTLVRLSKSSDLKRREVVTAIQMAKAKGDPLYTKLLKYQALRKQTRAKIVAKYGTKAARAALKGQKEYIKTMRGVNLGTNQLMSDVVTKDKNR